MKFPALAAYWSIRRVLKSPSHYLGFAPLLIFLFGVPAVFVQAQEPTTVPEAKPVVQIEEQAEQESEEADSQHERLAKYLTGTKWTGNFLFQDAEEANLNPETYYILSAEKMEEGAYWKIVTRIKYGKNDLTVPLPLEIQWAGETPVITVDQLLVPGLGKFDARVLIRAGKYSGTWAHNEVGGHLFGQIEKMTEEELAEVEAAAEAKKRKRKK